MNRLLTGLAICLLAALSPAQILINECYTGQSDALEITNLGNTPVAMGGWRIEYGGVNTAAQWVPGAFTFPQFNLAPDQSIVLVENTNFPPTSTTARVFVATQNISWATTGAGQTRGGAAILVDPAGVGVDMVTWLGATPPNTFGASFTGTVNPTDSAIQRLTRVDTDTAADWGSLSNTVVTFGEINPGQVIPTDVYDLQLIRNGPNSLEIRTISDFPPMPNAEIWNLPSFQNNGGNGPLFGVGLDALTWFQYPLDPNGIIHTRLESDGTFSRQIDNIPTGLHIEVVSLALGATGLERVSNVAIIDF